MNLKDVSHLRQSSVIGLARILQDVKPFCLAFLAGAQPLQHQLSARGRVSQGQPTSQDAALVDVLANNQKHPSYFSCYTLGFLTERC